MGNKIKMKYTCNGFEILSIKQRERKTLLPEINIAVSQFKQSSVYLLILFVQALYVDHWGLIGREEHFSPFLRYWGVNVLDYSWS